MQNCNILNMNGNPFRTPLFRWGYNAWNSSQVNQPGAAQPPSLPCHPALPPPHKKLSSQTLSSSSVFVTLQALSPECVAAEAEVRQDASVAATPNIKTETPLYAGRLALHHGAVRGALHQDPAVPAQLRS